MQKLWLNNGDKMKFNNTINFSNLEKDVWYKITLINPEFNCRIFKIPNARGKFEPYIQYKGYLSELGEERVFKISLPFYKWRNYINTLPMNVRNLDGKDIEFELMKLKYGKMDIRNWKVIE